MSGRTIDAEINRVSRLLAGSRRGLTAWLERYVMTRVALRAHHTLAQRERHHPTAVLSQDAETGLQMYLAGPIRHELDASLAAMPTDTSFVFGHTHKPFVATRGIPGYPRPMNVVNTGGWVIDHPEPEPLKGATAVLVDVDLNLVALELYRQRTDGTVAPPAALAVGARSGPFAESVRAGLESNARVWSQLTAALDGTVVARRRQLHEHDEATEARIASADAGRRAPGRKAHRYARAAGQGFLEQHRDGGEAERGGEHLRLRLLGVRRLAIVRARRRRRTLASSANDRASHGAASSWRSQATALTRWSTERSRSPPTARRIPWWWATGPYQ